MFRRSRQIVYKYLTGKYFYFIVFYLYFVEYLERYKIVAGEEEQDVKVAERLQNLQWSHAGGRSEKGWQRSVQVLAEGVHVLRGHRWRAVLDREMDRRTCAECVFWIERSAARHVHEQVLNGKWTSLTLDLVAVLVLPLHGYAPDMRILSAASRNVQVRVQEVLT